MAADVSSLVRARQGYKDDNDSSPITMDLLGSGNFGSKEDHKSDFLDLDMDVPNGYEKRLDLTSGKVYLQRCNSPSSFGRAEDSNTVASPCLVTLNLFEDRKTVQTPAYSSVCTLENVKSALTRAEKEPLRKRGVKCNFSPTLSTSASSSGSKTQDDENEGTFGLMHAACCPGCLSYVLVSAISPRCPRCNGVVPLPPAKKSRIDVL